MMILAPGNEVVFQCLGHIPGDPWLDGDTGAGTVGLRPDTDNFTGTRWRVHDGGNGAIMLECLGHIAGNRWLDGRTHDGTVGLAPTTSGGFTGTRWRVVILGDGSIRLQCLGNVPGNRWLDGRTHDGTVGLASDIGGVFTGTRWFVSLALSNFTFDTSITALNRNTLVERHRFAISRVDMCSAISFQEKERLFATYRQAIQHGTSNNPNANAEAIVNGTQIWINFTNLFPLGNAEIAQSLIHEMMHCAGYTHPNKQTTDLPFDNGFYYGTPPLQAEICIAGQQSDVLFRLTAKSSEEVCSEVDGVYIIRTQQ